MRCSHLPRPTGTNGTGVRDPCLGRVPTDSNGSNGQFTSSVFSLTWGLCFSLKANPQWHEKHRILAHFWHSERGCFSLTRGFVPTEPRPYSGSSSECSWPRGFTQVKIRLKEQARRSWECRACFSAFRVVGYSRPAMPIAPTPRRIRFYLKRLEDALNAWEMMPATHSARNAVLLALLSKALYVSRAICTLVEKGFRQKRLQCRGRFSTFSLPSGISEIKIRKRGQKNS